MNLHSCAAGIALATLLPFTTLAQVAGTQSVAPQPAVTTVPFETVLRQGQPPSPPKARARMTGDSLHDGTFGNIYLDGSISTAYGIYASAAATSPNIYTSLGNSSAGTYWFVGNTSAFPLLRVEASGGVMMALAGGFTSTNPGGSQLTMYETSNQNHDVLQVWGGTVAGSSQAVAKLSNGDLAANAGTLTLFHDSLTQTVVTGSALSPSFFNGKLAVGRTTVSSGYNLDVSGGLHADTINANTVTGNNITAVYQDLAEWVPASESIDAGTVVVISPDATNEVSPSSHAYQTSVAGVVSDRPGLLLGVGSASKAKIATTGRVKVKVDARQGAIRRGDLLVTSDRRGVAMKSQPVSVGGIEIHRPGTLVGKALEPLESGEGEILVLLSLQ